MGEKHKSKGGRNVCNFKRIRKGEHVKEKTMDESGGKKEKSWERVKEVKKRGNKG